MSIFKRKVNFKKIENIILLIGVILIVLRLFFPVLQCRNVSNDKVLCPKGLVSFISTKPDPNYEYHKERTYAQAVGMAILTGSLYFITRKKGFWGN